MAHRFLDVLVHLVFSTKVREDWSWMGNCVADYGNTSWVSENTTEFRCWQEE